MTPYLFEDINRYKRYSELVEFKSEICDRAWVVISYEKEREVYKFKEDGTIYIVLSGKVTHGTWDYDISDNTVVITAPGLSYMVHPVLYDMKLLVLQVDGTNECFFMIDGNHAESFPYKNVHQLMEYFKKKEEDKIREGNEEWLMKERAFQEAVKKVVAEESKRRMDVVIKERFIAYLEKNNYKKYQPSFTNGQVDTYSWIISILLTIVFFAFVLFTLREKFNIHLLFVISIALSCLVAYTVHIYLVLMWTDLLEPRQKAKYREREFDMLLEKFENLPEYRGKIDYLLRKRLMECA